MANVSENQFPTPQSLSDWLKPRIPSDSFSHWGIKPGTKNVDNLWLELSEGESTLLLSLTDSTPLVRSVECVVVNVLDGTGRVLLESKQELSNGSIRERGRPLSEKMKQGEEVDKAALRAIKEELEFKGEAVEILAGTHTKEVEERVAESYPGLWSRYTVHRVDARVEGLPKEDFSTEEEEYKDCSEGTTGLANKAVHVKKHFWTWAAL